MVTACTAVSRSELAYARLLASSFLAHHPDGQFTVLVTDDEGRELDESAEGFARLHLSDLGLDHEEILTLAMLYDGAELAAAVRPLLLRHLLHTRRTEIIYLDPDFGVFGCLEEMSRLSGRHSIVLVPRATVPLPHDELRIDESDLLAAGAYTLGLIGVGARSDAFIEWWWRRARRSVRTDPLRMNVADAWTDIIPCFFEHYLLTDSAYNVGYWNLHARTFTTDGDAYRVDGQMLKCFHFSGFDSRRPYLLSKYQGDRPRVLLSERPALAKICGEYVYSLERVGLHSESARAYGWGALSSGIAIDRRMRRLYREALAAHERGVGPRPPNPFDGTDEPFLEWLNQPASGAPPGVSRFLFSIYEDRHDLRIAFPDLAGQDVHLYLDWVRTEGTRQERIPAPLVQHRVIHAQGPERVPLSQITKGVNIVGHFSAELGIGEAARHLLEALKVAEIPHSVFIYDDIASRKAHPFSESDDGRAPHDVNVMCLNADQTATFVREVGSGFFEERHTAGYWFWELEHFPESMYGAFDLVDEVWVASDFVANSVRAAGRRPVYTIPLPIPVPTSPPGLTRGTFCLPERFMFLFMFDFFSVLERKNPLGLIDAFSRAFRPDEGPILLIKTINGHARIVDLERVRAAAVGRPDIMVIDEYYAVGEKNALLGLCDCYVSLHRSEGLGLTMAEAMALEKPVIATGYSGNLTFMTPENSFLVDYVRESVPAGCGPYPEGSVWAKPDLDRAAEHMRRVFERPEEAQLRARLARLSIQTKHSLHASAVAVIERLEQIERSRRRRIAD